MTRSRRDPLPGNRLAKAILSLQPTAYWPLDDGGSPLRDVSRGWSASVTGTPSYGVAAPSPIGRGVTFSGTGMYATTSASVPTPASSISVAVMVSTTNATAATRVATGRGANTNTQASWDIILNSSHQPVFAAYQAGGSVHASRFCGSTVAINDGGWHLLIGTFDGTTIRGYRQSAAGFTSDSDATLTGTWHKASTDPVRIATRSGAASLFPGAIAHVAYWSDRVLTQAEARWLGAVTFGG